ncbi:hypothetical protein BV920_19810 [Pectobacterium odoriferum]|nr:hypothetical protein BV920_19810 [Pectobacterium odoriferum]
MPLKRHLRAGCIITAHVLSLMMIPVLDVRLVPGIVIRTLRVTLLSDSEYALTGYEYCARIM